MSDHIKGIAVLVGCAAIIGGFCAVLQTPPYVIEGVILAGIGASLLVVVVVWDHYSYD